MKKSIREMKSNLTFNETESVQPKNTTESKTFFTKEEGRSRSKSKFNYRVDR